MDAHLVRLYDHLAWADGLVLDALEKAGEPPERILRLLAHLLGAERIWLMRIRGEDTSKATVWPANSLAECRAIAGQTSAGYLAFLRTVPENRLDVLIGYRTSKGEPQESRLADILLHVALHGAYHRGQIAALVRSEGQEPAGTDFITFARARG